MPNPNVRVKIPTNPSELLKLAALIYAKHIADGAASRLKALDDYTWELHGDKVEQAQVLDAEATQMEKDLEEKYKQRDLLLAPVDATVKSSRDLLLGAYKKNYKKLGDWGFEVDDTPKAKKTTP